MTQGPAPFEPSMARLEEIVRLLESQETTLEQSLTLYEEGVRLSRTCQGILKETQRKVEQITRSRGDGAAITRPFDEADPGAPHSTRKSGESGA